MSARFFWVGQHPTRYRELGASRREKGPNSEPSCMVHGVACCGDFRSVDKVTHIGLISRCDQGRAVHVRVGTNILRMVVRVPCRVERGAVREVSDIIHELCEWQGCTGLVEVRAHALWMVLRVASRVHGSSIREVSDVVDVRQARVHLFLVVLVVPGWRIIPDLALDQGAARAACWIHADETCCRGLLLPVEGCSLYRGLACVAELFLPSRVYLVGIFLECQESPFELLVSLCVLDDTVRQAHIAVPASLPEHPCLLTLTARHGPLLGPILMAEGPTTGCQNDIGVTEILEEGG